MVKVIIHYTDTKGKHLTAELPREPNAPMPTLAAAKEEVAEIIVRGFIVIGHNWGVEFIPIHRVKSIQILEDS